MDRLPNDNVIAICQPYEHLPNHSNLELQTMFAAMAYLGMHRHKGLFPDWLAHRELWASSCNQIGQIINPTPSGMGINAEGEQHINKIRKACEKIWESE